MTSPELQPALGQPVDRVDGELKVTGRASYAYEYAEYEKVAYGHILGAAITRGRVIAIDATEAERAPGVLLVMTYRNAPPQAAFGPSVTPTVPEAFTRARPVLADDRVRYYDEPVALVVAESLEAARAAAGIIRIHYERETSGFDLHAGIESAYRPERTNAGFAPDTAMGDFEGAFASAPAAIDATYVTSFEHHSPMEPHATLAVWAEDQLTLHTSAQTLSNIQAGVANTLRMPPERIRVISRFVGGGFGSKLIPHHDAVFAALAARQLARPVKVALTRQQMFANAGHRAAMLQKVRLGASPDGRLAALAHEVWTASARVEEFIEQTAVFTRSLYAAPNRITRHRAFHVDTHRGEWMRAPGEAPGMLALECAMDELAERLGIDPIELRIRNEPDEDPERKIPFSTRNLVACMREGAKRFGWGQRPTRPASRREGRTLIGFGMAAAIRPNYLGPSTARVSIDAKGQVTAQLDMTDIGTGTYTILSQIVSETLGVPLSLVKVELGDSRFPRTAGSGGSWGATSCGWALRNACEALKQRIVEAARSSGRLPLRALDESVIVGGGAVRVGDRTENLASFVARVAPNGLAADGSVTRGREYQDYSQHGFGAHFAEVGVDCDTGEIRLRRMLGVFAAGRIFNPKTARSQMIGGMIWGVSAALLEESIIDPRYGHFVNHDLAEYHVAVNRDVPNVEAIFLDEHDEKANPFGAKGIGELGICGAAPAVANAVYNATGIRVREFPITLDKLLPGLPMVAV